MGWTLPLSSKTGTPESHRSSGVVGFTHNYAAANYNLKHLDVAEVNARRATELDNAHEIPRAELLLASVLVAKGDRSGGLQHFRKYLEIVPKAPDAEQVKRAIAQLEAPGDAK